MYRYNRHYVCNLYIIAYMIFLCYTFAEDKRRRPAPSYVLPVVELVEPQGTIYDPGKDDRNSAILREMLGFYFDPTIMSEVQPKAAILHPNGSVLLRLKKTKAGLSVPDGRPPKYIQRTHLQTLKLADGSKIPLKLGKKMKRRFRDVLWLQSHCPLLQRWKDLGTRFWPRWFLENSCIQKSSCSFPRGMTCRARKSANKVLLRWHCQNWETQSNCQWLKVQYPLVTECRCSC